MDYSTFSLHHNVSRETFERLEAYVALLLKWQKKINLISPSTIPEVWSRHILDSIQLVDLLPSAPSSVLDMGSGAGLPGIILAIATDHPISLVESDQRKSIFLQEASRHLGLNTTLYHCRIEEMNIPHSIITARALAPLSKLLNWAATSLSPSTTCYFPKGKDYAKEIDEARAAWDFDLTIHPSQTKDDAVILELSHIRRHAQ